MKFGNILIAALLALCIFFLIQKQEEKKALDSCIDEVSTNCKGLYDYAVSLEEENARLNRLYRECTKNENR